MASYTVNKAAVSFVRELIDKKRYVLDSDWGEVQPSADDQNAYLEKHSWDEYAAWHLGLTEGANDETKARYAFVVGDFSRVHRDGVDRVRLPGVGVASQGGRAGRAQPPAASGQGQRLSFVARSPGLWISRSRGRSVLL